VQPQGGSAMKLVYSDKAKLPIGEHIFHADKYVRIRERLRQSGAFADGDFLAPEPCRDEDLLLVHTKLWVEKVLGGMVSTREELELEIPYSTELVEAFCYMTGGSTLASKLALQHGCAVHLGGGFHHAFADHGEGFCMLHDVAVAIRCMQRDGRIARALVVDCDVHQGNGTAAIFGGGGNPPFPPESWTAPPAPSGQGARVRTSGAGDVFTVSLHQQNNYPFWKPPSSIDVDLPDGTCDADYLEWLETALEGARERFRPDLLCYIAGADPYCEDQLGGLALTMAGLMERDRTVYRFARTHGFPVMTTLAGGYARKAEDTVTIHVNTALTAKEIFG
jgi:acetoin utilization deacetylase AcuC-like enzyme